MSGNDGKNGSPPYRDDEEAALERAKSALHEASDALEIAEGLRDKGKVTAPETPREEASPPETDKEPAPAEEPPGPWWKEITQPFIDLVHASRALWGINLGYLLEGMCYFGVLGYLAMYFSDFVFKGIKNADEWSHLMLAILTAGITLSMVALGWVCDKWGVRRTLILAFVFLLAGRALISAASFIPSATIGLWGSVHLVTMGGIILIVIGYGMYQPSAYTAIKQFTTPKTAAMGFAMLYALQNLGGYLPSYAWLFRDDEYLGLGIPGTFWVYTGFTVVGLVATAILLSRRTVEQAIATAEAARTGQEEEGKQEQEQAETSPNTNVKLPQHIWLVLVAIIAITYWRVPEPYKWIAHIVTMIVVILSVLVVTNNRVKQWVARHPLADGKFFFFIFALIPVQTLFAYNWLVLPQYISRAYSGWIGEKFEFAANLNPILIFIAVPMIAALTRKADIYKMMVIGTSIMAAPAFLLVIGPYWWTLFPYIIIMTIGEAMWQPRFLQYAAEIAPKNRTGEYMGVAQLPWFLTKMLTPLLLTGWMMERYCPAKGETNTEAMWLIYACIAISSTVMLILAKGWIGKSLQSKVK
ncbi:MAG: MFS transporter [Parcubacteria group bacterium]|nr:MFS transporter [Parcubacteria group bacterium]